MAWRPLLVESGRMPRFHQPDPHYAQEEMESPSNHGDIRGCAFTKPQKENDKTTIFRGNLEQNVRLPTFLCNQMISACNRHSSRQDLMYHEFSIELSGQCHLR